MRVNQIVSYRDRPHGQQVVALHGDAPERRVVCVIDHLHRDPFVAAEACAGRFTHNGVTLDLGTAPDWRTSGLPHDEEWRIEWVKLYEGLNLAHVYAERPGEELWVWQRLVTTFCQQIEVGFDTSDVSARRVQNWIYTWQRFADAPHFPGFAPEFVELLTTRIVHEVVHLRSHLTAERNHRTLELYALFVAALAVPSALADHGQSGLLAFAVSELTENLLTDIRPDGVHRECSTDYHNIVVRSFVGVAANAAMHNITLPPSYFERLSRACNFSLASLRPDGLTPSFSDGDVVDFRELLARAADVLRRDDLRWAASLGEEGRPPAERDAVFPVGGYAVQRSGWGKDATSFADEHWLMFDCGPLGDGGHGHYDHLSIEIAAHGRSVVVDPGRYTYAVDADGWRQWFKGTRAHNTITVDGLDQTAFRGGKPKGRVSTATLEAYRSEDLLSLVAGRAVSPRYDAVHTRRIAFLGRQCWLVHDVLEASTRHNYEVRWHLPATGCVQVDGHDPIVVRSDTAVFVTLGATLCCVEQGWVSPRYGEKQEAPVICTSTDAENHEFFTLIAPAATRASLVLREATTRERTANVIVNTQRETDSESGDDTFKGQFSWLEGSTKSWVASACWTQGAAERQ